jgi:hypothetical protein
MEKLRLSHKEKLAFKYYADLFYEYGDEAFAYNSAVCKYAGLTYKEVTSFNKKLRSLDLLEYKRGLFDDEGMTAGSGNALTRKGYDYFIKLWNQRVEKQTKKEGGE